MSLAASCADEPPQNASDPTSSTIQVTDDAQREVTLIGPARRIVSLVPASTETLLALGAGDRLVARTDFDDDLAHLPSLGGGLTPNIELLATLHPDLVIVWNEAGNSRIRARLEGLDIPVFAVQTIDTAGVFADVRRFGILTGMPNEADSLATWMRTELAAVSGSIADREPVSVAYMIGLDPPMAAGPNVYIGEILEVAGGRNVFADVEAPTPHISLEQLVKRRPKVVFVPGDDIPSVSVERLRTLPGWREVAAGGARFITLPADMLHRPGPSIVEAAWEIRDAIYPDLAGSR